MLPSLQQLLSRSAGRRRRDPAPRLDELHGRYRLRFARGADDVAAVQALRFEVFNLELGEGLDDSYATRLDREPFDDVCQHVIVADTETDRVVGTYRLQTREIAEAGHGWYAATEFDVDALSPILGRSVEAGRACVAKAHRHRSVLHLLWRGLAAYAVWHGKRVFFGCSSLTSQDEAFGLAADLWFERQGYRHATLRAPALASHACRAAEPSNDAVAAFRPPKLFATYLRHGAEVVSEPAIDRFFGTIDFLTAVDLLRVDKRLLTSITRGLPG